MTASERSKNRDKSSECSLCTTSESVSVHAKIGHDLVERVDGHDLLVDRMEGEELNEETFAQIGRQILHKGGPAPTPGQEAFADLSERFAKEEILPRISEEIIEEHRKNPIGQHSDDLQRVLHYFRRQPSEGKYVVIETERSQEWAIGELSGERGIPPKISDERFDSVEAAVHEIFRKRVDELQETHGNT
jgi:branched-chain amino acid transport system permease protein